MITNKPTVLTLQLEWFGYSGSTSNTLNGMSLALSEGSLTVIVGDSGSGKSTLGAIMAGMLPRHEGDQLEATLQLAGQKICHGGGSTVRIDPVGWARAVGMLPQDARHYLSGVRETVAEELALGMENAGVPRQQMHERIAELADRLELGYLLARDPGTLSGGQERLVALAALALDAPPVLVLDEPLAGLDTQAARLVVELLGRLRAAGTALVLLTRALDSLVADAQQILFLRGGALHASAVLAPASLEPFAPAQRPITRKSPELLLDFADVALAYPGCSDAVVSGLELQIRAGECVALTGPNGSGKTTVLKAAAGLLAPSSGRIGGAAVRSKGVGLLLQNPADQLFERTVGREVGFGLRRRGAEISRIPSVLATLGLSEYLDTHPYELPASVRRLVALATVLVHEPAVLLLDEPSEALDAHGVARLLTVITAVVDRGGAVLLTTHDEAFLEACAHRVHRMRPALRASQPTIAHAGQRGHR